MEHATRARSPLALAALLAFPMLLAAACVPAEAVPCQDLDGDGYGSDNDPACLFAGTDCDDGDPWINPGAQEICGNGKDDDCSRGDEPCPQPRCEDNDGDGYGVGPLCLGPDCDDNNNRIHPGAGEVCGDGIDNDCADGDRACPPSCSDADDDGYGEGAGCWGPDCNDRDPAINPGAFEVCGDGIDNDCSGGDEVCLPRCGDGWLSLGTVAGTDMTTVGDVSVPDPTMGSPWILLSPGVLPGDEGTAWVGWVFDAELAPCVTDLSIFVYAFDDSSIGSGADISFDAGDGTPGERIANIDADEMWYGGTMTTDDHLACDVHTCVLWVVIDAEMLDLTHVREAEAAVYLDLI
jgi:hypothetical protein